MVAKEKAVDTPTEAPETGLRKFVREWVTTEGRTLDVDSITDLLTGFQRHVEEAGVESARSHRWCGVFGATMTKAFPHGPLDGVAWRDAKGFDCEGYARDGFHTSGYDRHGFNRDGFNRQGWDRDGYDKDGLNGDGFNRDGRDKFGLTLADYTEPDRYGNPNQYTADGYGRTGIHKDTGLDRDGYNINGRDANGYDREGYDRAGWHRETDLDRYGYARDGFHPETGRNKAGFDREGFNANGYDINGLHRDTRRTWDGYDRDGYNEEGFDRYGGRNPNFRPLATATF